MGKPQIIEDPKKPAAGFARPGFTSPEDIEEMQEQMQSVEKARIRMQGRATKVSKFLKDNYFRTDKTFPFLFYPPQKMQLSVRYFFPKKNLAIDQFRVPTKIDLLHIEFKKKAFKANGIKYFPMMPENKLMDLYEYI